jgi:hypothetical protein
VLSLHARLCRRASVLWLIEQGTAKICIPSAVTHEKLRDVGVAWIRKEVQDLSEPIEVNLAMAFFHEWPCRKEK